MGGHRGEQRFASLKHAGSTSAFEIRASYLSHLQVARVQWCHECKTAKIRPVSSVDRCVSHTAMDNYAVTCIFPEKSKTKVILLDLNGSFRCFFLEKKKFLFKKQNNEQKKSITDSQCIQINSANVSWFGYREKC